MGSSSRIQKALDGLVETMNENPTIVIELGSHRPARPIPMTTMTLFTTSCWIRCKNIWSNTVSMQNVWYAKGYGANEPRVLDREIGSFKAGDVMTMNLSVKLKSTKVKEEAHQLNRRTEFKVLRTNCVKVNLQSTISMRLHQRLWLTWAVWM